MVILRMIDFTQIRGLSDGQRQSFEELVCQLARREIQPHGSQFRRVEGSGGDGGLEAYWLLPNGEKIGYQAKFFTRARDIDWAQIDESVQQALDTHPTLEKYVIAIPCDLTDRRGSKSKGMTGWENWDSRRGKWQRHRLTTAGKPVQFTPWTAFELRDKLSAIPAEGLRKYWFGSAEFSTAWFNQHIRLATNSLDERYHPEDHVDVSLEGLFQFLTRSRQARTILHDHLAAVKMAPIPDRRLRGYEPKLPLTLIEASTTALASLLELSLEFDLPCWQEWNNARWKTSLENLDQSVGELRKWAWSAREALPEQDGDKAKHDIDFILNDLNKTADTIGRFLHLIDGDYLAAEHNRAALVEGRAGTGKSHLLGRIAEVAASEGRPVILILGQQLTDQPLWDQINKRLGLDNFSPDTILQALDAAAEAANKRGMVLIDAINEGAGARLWKPEIAEFLARLKRYPNLVCVVTCRTEYVTHIVPEGVLANIERFTIRGFETADEHLRAARIYLDKRGISRPSTPWIAPEFVNPLFLRSVCLALNREGLSEFPRGLHGTKEVLSFYLKSVGRNLGVGRDGSDDLVSATASSIRAMAAKMAADRTDYISLEDARVLAENSFRGFPSPKDQSWLEVLHRNGLLRSDPDPTAESSDPLIIHPDVIRFSFQRFQDHLMAETLLSNVTNIRDSLREGGPLAFIHDGKTLQWQWHGLAEALSIQIPERFGVELVDALPGNADRWWETWEIPDAFAESVRWRNKIAFNDRTLDFFNRLSDTNVDQFGLLIELSTSIDHPWNADFLHENLVKRSLPNRDHFWTTQLNEASVNEGDSVGRLIDWALFGQSKATERFAQRLCAITLCWFFTSSNRNIRDKATKALSSLLIARSDLFSELCKLFKESNDIYVIERLLAAAYGSCCIDPINPRLQVYSAETFNLVFSERKAPLSLLLRDYARGIVELAFAKSALSSHISIEECRPPYHSSPPLLTVSEEAVKKIAEKAGDATILHSCESMMGDFASYEIKPRVGSFSNVSLRSRQPVSERLIFELFETEVIDINEDRISAVKTLREKHASSFLSRLPRSKKKEAAEAERIASDILSAEAALLALLSPSERQRYRKEASHRLGITPSRNTPKIPEIDFVRARRWVAKRAYDIGWTKTLFPNESSRYRNHSRERPLTERIGKKYQWIALDELLCRLADNYWISSRYDDASKAYDNPLDVGYERDIDPTILPLTNGSDISTGTRPAWVSGNGIELEHVEESELAAWPFLADPVDSLPALIRRLDDDGAQWTTLYEHRSTDDRYENENGNHRVHGLRQQAFHFVMCVVVGKADRNRLVESLANKKSLDVMEWDPLEFTDGPFLREAPWRNTWNQEQWRVDVWNAPKGMQIAFPACRYLWESHLDATLPEGAKALIPSPWLSKALSLSIDKDDAAIYRINSSTVFLGSMLGDGCSSALVAEEPFFQYLDANGLECLWLFVGERKRMARRRQ